MPLYREMPEAEITCLDYSPEMLERAKSRGEGLAHVRFQQGDVGALPFGNSSFDIVLSLNGFHAFPDKEAAWREIFRVLRPGGIFCGCFYVTGQNRRTDWIIRRLYVPKGWFTPPFETAESLRHRLEAAGCMCQRAGSPRPLRRRRACGIVWRKHSGLQRSAPFRAWRPLSAGRRRRNTRKRIVHKY